MKIHPGKLRYVGPLYRDSYVNQALVDDIREKGQLRPIYVKQTSEGYDYEAGMCRVVACLILGIDVKCKLLKN